MKTGLDFTAVMHGSRYNLTVKISHKYISSYQTLVPSISLSPALPLGCHYPPLTHSPSRSPLSHPPDGLSPSPAVPLDSLSPSSMAACGRIILSLAPVFCMNTGPCQMVWQKHCWLRQLLHELHRPLSRSALVYCDNVGAISPHQPGQAQHIKHVEIDMKITAK